MTLVAPLKEKAQLDTPSIVKVTCSPAWDEEYLVCHDFERSHPKNSSSCYYHWGIYAYKRQALKTFVTLPQTDREKERSLEQLRALDYGMKFWAALIPKSPYMCVDTPQDLERVRLHMDQSYTANNQNARSAL